MVARRKSNHTLKNEKRRKIKRIIPSDLSSFGKKNKLRPKKLKFKDFKKERPPRNHWPKFKRKVFKRRPHR